MTNTHCHKFSVALPENLQIFPKHQQQSEQMLKLLLRLIDMLNWKWKNIGFWCQPATWSLACKQTLLRSCKHSKPLYTLTYPTLRHSASQIFTFCYTSRQQSLVADHSLFKSNNKKLNQLFASFTPLMFLLPEFPSQHRSIWLPGTVRTCWELHCSGHSVSLSFCYTLQHIALGFHKGVMPLPVCWFQQAN